MAKKLVDVHEKAKSYDWDFTFADQSEVGKYETRYKLPKKGKDPFRVLIRDYLKMEAEKDDRTFGFLDGALRTKMADQIQPRFMECLKLTLPDLTNAEFQAVAGAARIISSIRNQELRQGYHAQMMDEVRHTQLEMALRDYYVKNWQDPAGWDITQKALYQHPGGLVSIALFQNFNTGDLIDCIVNLNICVETAFTNILLVATPQTAALNGDHAMASTFLSIQSDESRHMANGYGSVMMVLAEEDNVEPLNEALERHFWHCHRGLDALVGWQSEYGATVRPHSFREMWEEWVVDDFVGSYVDRLTEFGVRPPARLGAAAESVRWMHHTIGMVFAAIWPLNFWRSDPMRPEDFDWFESHYPGWYDVYGGFWEAYAQMTDPSSGHLMLQELSALPPFCQVCQLPCVVPRPDQSDMRVVEYEGKRFAVCSEGCEWIFKRWPTAHAGRKQFWERYDGWDLADVILDLGYIRPDGKTLIGQPSVDLPPDRLWTIDDIRRLGIQITNPMNQL
ncbi:methane monooxygenase [Carbonactinospora thermoautotrophica]|uniref:propane 2-monooxygenase n=1 Tax=Carbonactinospora thermoautotrophica TaxID=1469144 RepID=A0A132MMJ5_9ACTN|nr:methane monooxygenase [Carbonactinospora thermoautotrophica]KWW99077.1 Methane monooxygenase component A alpha chain [Carbonactinospora thermoautotrophica]KWX05105.1 methane monooxygenase [Carbonactinospora thermoautotrophica]KWX05816.1 methane monooxygenase [Carbonactinospora thermoautotrophica]